MSHFFGDSVSLVHRTMRIHGHIQFHVQPVTQPTGPHLRYAFDAFGVTGRLADFINDPWLNAVQYPGEYSLAGLPHDPDKKEGDEQSDDGVGQRIAKRNPDRAEQDG